MASIEQRPSQASRIIEKFGGAQPLAAALKLTKSAIYRWTYPRAKNGTGGLIPTGAVPKIQAAAKRRGIRLTAKDWEP